jgi:ubiquinone/menaquinone biosynthesis C-methylase UbiE
MAGKLVNSLLFIAAGLLLGVVSSIAFVLAAKEKVRKQLGEDAHAFLADKKRALVFYNVLSSVYDILNPHLYTFSMREKITNLLNCGEELQVLDAGCGTGYTTKGILKLHNLNQVVGVDQNHRQLQKASKNLQLEKTKTSLSRGDIENLPFNDETFDVVVSVGAVEYFPEPERALREMMRVTRHNGKLIVGGPEFDWFKQFFLHRIFYTPAVQDFRNMFSKIGLQNVRIILTGVNTLFGTNKYVLVAMGTKN